MEPRLARTVWVTPPGRAQRVRLPAGSTPPEWSWPLITNPAAWSIRPAPVQQPGPDGPEGDSGPPPMHGKGSSRDAWAAYADGQGVTVPDGASRAEIVAALDQANIRTV